MDYRKLSKIADSVFKVQDKAKHTKSVRRYLEKYVEAFYNKYQTLFDKWSLLGEEGDVIASDEGEGYSEDGAQWNAYHGCDALQLADFALWRLSKDEQNEEGLVELIDYFTGVNLADLVNNKESRNNSIKDSVEQLSPQMEELIEAFEDMDDDEEETVVTVSEEIPQEEIDEFVNRYMEHNPEGDEEFILTITPLGNKQYKISCPYVWDETHQVSDSTEVLTFENAWDGGSFKVEAEVVWKSQKASLGRDVCIIKVGDKYQDLLDVGGSWMPLTDKSEEIEPKDNWADNDINVKCPKWFTLDSLAELDDLSNLKRV